ncbi:unnamed protein product, partial [Cyprideis torosa]
EDDEQCHKCPGTTRVTLGLQQGGSSRYVHLFEWKWGDIARECEEFLGPRGFGAVQTSPPTECIVIRSNGIFRPWYERMVGQSMFDLRASPSLVLKQLYQAATLLRLHSNQVYPDIVFNHMTGDWPAGTPTTGGSSFNSDTLDYPAVPYSAFDFHGPAECPSGSGYIESYQDAVQVRNCRLFGGDLRQESEYVRDKIVTFLNRLISYGVAGFRLDAAKHMWPGDLDIIFSRLNDLNTEFFPPVSYKLESRSGSEQDFVDMVRRCNNANVRVYPDIVFNHMTGDWPAGTPTTGGSSFNSDTLDYPGVPYSAFDFHGPAECPSGSGYIESYQDAVQVRNCRLFGGDLRQESEYVRDKIVAFLNRLISYGVAGFRLDAAKHMWPGDLDIIFSRLNDLNTEFFSPGSRPFILMEVIDLGGEAITASEYTYIGRVTEFKYGKYLGEVWRKLNELQWLGNFGEGWGMEPGGSVVVFLDNHDNQRGHGAGGQNILTFRASRMYKMATAYMLAWPYGFPRIMSSYYWDQDWQGGVDKNDWVGPPMDGNENILDVSINPDGTCGNGWICEHRWRQIYNMVAFRNAAGISAVENFVTGTAHQIAFARSGKGFIAINNDDWASWTGAFATTLPAGDYCDVISGSKENGGCTGKTITVDAGGMAYIDISASEEDPMIAIHVDAKL